VRQAAKAAMRINGSFSSSINRNARLFVIMHTVRIYNAFTEG
jgi:hypothetical protein